MNRDETLDLLRIIQGAYPNFYRGMSKRQAEGTLDVWQDILGGCDYLLVEAAVKAYIAADTRGYPPAIGQIVEKIRFLTQPKETTENEAWDIVYKAICNSAYDSKAEFAKLPPDIQSVVHSPAQLRAWAIDPDFNMGVESSNFKRSYRMRAAQMREFQALPGEVKDLVMALQDGMDMRLLLPEGGDNK